ARCGIKHPTMESHVARRYGCWSRYDRRKGYDTNAAAPRTTTAAATTTATTTVCVVHVLEGIHGVPGRRGRRGGRSDRHLLGELAGPPPALLRRVQHLLRVGCSSVTRRPDAC